MSTLTLVPYHRKHRTAILNLLYYSQRAHVHLDWDRPGQWIEREGVQLLLAWEGSHLAGFIGLTPPLNGASWLRLVGLSSRHHSESVLNMLWQGIQPNLQKLGIEQVAVLVIHQWLEPLLPQLGFKYKEDVITLYRSEDTAPPLPEVNSSLVIQPAYTEHLPQIVSVDNAAFPAPWQMSASDIFQARRQASQYMVALANNRVVGFQISTRHRGIGHLARLAVQPTMQGHGVGTALVTDMIQRLQQYDIKAITVNTQHSNYQSQALYRHFDFRRNGLDFPVWTLSLS